MQDNNGQNTINNQPSIPQVSDMPPMPTIQTPVAPLTPLDPSPMTEPASTFSPTTPPLTTTIPPIPQVTMDSPEKKSPVATIALVVLLIAILAGAAYFIGKMYLGSDEVATTTESVVAPGDLPAENQDIMPPADPELSLDDIPTTPEDQQDTVTGVPVSDEGLEEQPAQ